LGKDVEITPLPEPGKPEYLKQDALQKGAKMVNKRYGVDCTFVHQLSSHPAKPDMRVYLEEQFGPVVPIASFKKKSEVFDYLAQSPYGQQASVFSTNPTKIANLIDVLVNLVCRVNINCQCQRGPDKFPFTVRYLLSSWSLSLRD